jgi:hypothetical protein
MAPGGAGGSDAGHKSHLKSVVPDTVTAISVTAVTSKRISIRVSVQLLCMRLN